MAEHKSRQPVYQDYYTEDDYDDVLTKLPEIVEYAKKKAGEVIEPTVSEKNQIMEIIRDFIRRKERIVYGGMAIHEAIRHKNPEDGIYKPYEFADIEFYSPEPVVDLVELSNILYEKGFKYPTVQEAQHDETYVVYVNFQQYCDITYVPKRIYYGIKTIVIDGIHYVHPHFILIDQFRIFNQPLTSADQRWEKTFKRMYKMLKYYPLEFFNKPMKMPDVPDEARVYIKKIKEVFMMDPSVQNNCLISGFDAFNFYIKQALQKKGTEMARVNATEKQISRFIVDVPFMELISVDYYDTVEKMFSFLKETVVDSSSLTMEEFFPLFQLTGYSVVFYYQEIPIVRIYQGDNFCVPYVKTTKGYMYVSYQYLLMFMMINKFRAYLDKDRQMYFNYGIAISNLIEARNYFLSKNNLPIINGTIFSEFRIQCVGSTVSFARESKLRQMENYKKTGRRIFRYSPEDFFALSKESQEKFDPSKHKFKNTSGNKIRNTKNDLFRFDNGELKINEYIEESESDDE